MSSGSTKDNFSIEVEADLLDQAELYALKTSAENLLVKISNCTPVEGGWDICDAVWPVFKMKTEKTRPKLILLPLSRLGVPQGYSGSHVMVGYFIDAGETGLFPSRPMIVKLERKVDATSDQLSKEMANAQSIKVFVAYHRDSFALPLHYDSLSEHSLLWSPFSSSKWTFEAYQQSRGERLSLAIDDLLAHLRKNGGDEITRQIITTVYQFLMPLHLAAGTAKRLERQLVKEYDSYLRNIEGAWANEWRDTVWAPDTQESVFDFNRDWKNPFWVLTKLRHFATMPLFCGAVHGDLHPRNVVLSDNNMPHIIDFGWTTDGSHVAKDFVLMEANLRFVVLSPSVPYQVIETMAGWMNFDSTCPNFAIEYCDSRVGLIQRLREIAKTYFPTDTNWNYEYVIPLFLVSLGLLKHLRDFDNQIAARFTVLSLANYIAEEVIPNA